MGAPHPWSVVPAADYERFMGPDGLGQRATLDALFEEAWLTALPERLLVVGCATGAGLEHVDPAVTRRLVGLDVNLQYLGVCRQRFFHLGPALELYCADALAWRGPAGAFDLVHAALVLEHVDAGPLVERLAGWLSPGGTCTVVLDLPGDAPPVPAPPALAAARGARRLVPPEDLRALFAGHGLSLRRAREVPQPHGQRLWAGAFGR
jgi:hypothetical protein